MSIPPTKSKTTNSMLGGGGSGRSMSTVSMEDSTVSSSHDDGVIEMGLELSLGSNSRANQLPTQPQFARFLAAKDLSSASSSSLSSSSTDLGRACGKKRCADSLASINAVSNQLVGWPPIRAYRMNSMTNQAKSAATQEFCSMIEQNKSKKTVIEKTSSISNKNNYSGCGKNSSLVKVNVDGFSIGRKIDLKAHDCYETLTQALEQMFFKPRPITNDHGKEAEVTRPLNLLDGSSEFVLTYEDREGDWMLVGDVPWSMFVGSVRRLKIMRTSEGTRLGL